MNYKTFCAHFAANKRNYLPFLYPLVMPMITFYSAKIAVYSPSDLLPYCVSLGCLHIVLLVLFRKIIYLKTYKRPIRWLIAVLFGGLTVGIYLFLEYHLLHFTAVVFNPNPLRFIMRTMMNIPILLILSESIKSADDRKRLLIDNIALATENTKAQYNLLLQQINPHFLFNCLTVLQAMARSKDARTEDFISQLETVYRQALKTDKGTVTVREELDFFKAYMFLMTLRQESAILVEVNIADDSLGYHLPAFALQLLAENCMKHNIVSASKPLCIRLYQKDPKTLTISNNYQPRPQKPESFGIGIQNLKKRYALEGIADGVQVEQLSDTYTTTIKLF